MLSSVFEVEIVLFCFDPGKQSVFVLHIYRGEEGQEGDRALQSGDGLLLSYLVAFYQFVRDCRLWKNFLCLIEGLVGSKYET